MLNFFKKKKLQKDFYLLKNKIELLEKCSPGGHYLVATHVRNIILKIGNITTLNNKYKVYKILEDINAENKLLKTEGYNNQFNVPIELVQSLFVVLYRALNLNNFHLELGVVELLGRLTRKGEFYRDLNEDDKDCYIGGESLHKAVEKINFDYEHNNLDGSLREEDTQNILAMADFKRSIEDGSFGAWVRSWKTL